LEYLSANVSNISNIARQPSWPYSSFAKASLAGPRIDFPRRLDRLPDLVKSRAFACGTFDFWRNLFCFRLFHRENFFRVRKTNVKLAGARAVVGEVSACRDRTDQSIRADLRMFVRDRE